ncbi:TPA: hypothetical protein LSH87_003759 [Citrobacter koseri]|uniref:hypothetical protein n=1 Tax=Citrobacter koseri TaxID=545 RepID=UPI0023B00E1A|nr:hypothetical protein [Citrobacter koseri]HBL6925850.1 hypothetical protein [Citrobacter koseri]HBL6930753.1 hypothetical protein [Citrobacter koseri]
MRTITKERLEQIANFHNQMALPPSHAEIEELARIALASLEAGSDSNNHPASGPLSDYRLHRIREILGKAAAQSDGGNIGYAMSDAVKAFDELLEGRCAKPAKRVNADQMHRVCLEANRHLGKYEAMAKEVNKLLGRTAPPAPVVPEAKCDDDGNTTSEFDHGWNACRAAMLNGGKS